MCIRDRSRGERGAREVRPDPVGIRTGSSRALVVALDQQMVGRPPVEARQGEGRGYDQCAQREGHDRTCSAAEQEDGCQERGEERQTVAEVAGQPEQQPGAQRRARRVPGRAGGREGQQCHGPRRYGGEVAVSRGSGPDGERGEDEERSRAPGEVLARQGTQRDHGGHRGGASEDDAPRTGPGAAPESGPVQADEGERGARRVPGDVGGPVARRSDHDVVGEAAQGGADVVETVDHPQVFVLGGQPALHPPVPALDQGEREDPGHRAGPAGEEQRPVSYTRVPGPRCGSQEARRGGHWTCRLPSPCWMSHPAPMARATSSTPAAAAARSRRPPAVPVGAAGSAGSAVRVGALRSSVVTLARYAPAGPQ